MHQSKLKRSHRGGRFSRQAGIDVLEQRVLFAATLATPTVPWATESTAADLTYMAADAVSTPAVTGLTLINADTDQPIGTLTAGSTFDFALLGTRNLNVRADT